MPVYKQALSILLSFSVTLSVIGLDGCGKKKEEAQTAPAQGQPAQQAPTTTYATPTADQLYQLVAPIALFPDNLLAQVLAASTYPDQVTAAYNWLQQNSGLKGQQLMEAVNQQPWDASVKGLTQFPDVLSQLATNLSWTSALGDAYFNVPQSVMNAVQAMRSKASAAGNLKSNQQQTVSVQNTPPGQAPPPPDAAGDQQTVIVQSPPQTIVIQSAQPEVVYVPTYNPTAVYGAPVAVYPGYSTGAMVATSLLSFGVGIAVGAATSNSCCGWGYNSWNCGWHNNTVVYNHNTYISNSNTFVNRNNYNRNVNNINTNNINRNNINRNNINTNNINRNNVNANNRVNNFNGRQGGMTEPHFNAKHDQAQYRNYAENQQRNQGLGANNQQRPNQAGNNARLNQQPAAGNRGGNFNQGQHNQPQRDAARGYGQPANRGTSTGAFNGYSAGGNARTNSARGQQSLAGNRPQGGGNVGANRGGGGARPEPHGGGGRRR